MGSLIYFRQRKDFKESAFEQNLRKSKKKKRERSGLGQNMPRWWGAQSTDLPGEVGTSLLKTDLSWDYLLCFCYAVAIMVLDTQPSVFKESKKKCENIVSVFVIYQIQV